MRPVLFVFLMISMSGWTQELTSYNQDRLNTDRKLMLTLGSWATVNMVGSGVAWATLPEGEARYFHQMNVMWNAVNLGLAIPGYIKARKTDLALSFSETLKAQNQTEKVFLFNGALDVAYMTGGLLLREMGENDPAREQMFKGFGNSLLLQGGFLFIFDLTAYAIHKRHANKVLSPFLEKIELSHSGIGIRYNLN